MKSPLSLIQSILIKLLVLGLGVALVLWFGWSGSQSHHPRSTPFRGLKLTDGIDRPETSFPLNINQGTKEELQTLPGIGPVLAGRIIDYRESNGPFGDLEDLKAIEGIGETKLAQIRSHITVNKSAIQKSHKATRGQIE